MAEGRLQIHSTRLPRAGSWLDHSGERQTLPNRIRAANAAAAPGPVGSRQVTVPFGRRLGPQSAAKRLAVAKRLSGWTGLRGERSSPKGLAPAQVSVAHAPGRSKAGLPVGLGLRSRFRATSFFFDEHGHRHVPAGGWSAAWTGKRYAVPSNDSISGLFNWPGPAQCATAAQTRDWCRASFQPQAFGFKSTSWCMKKVG